MTTPPVVSAPRVLGTAHTYNNTAIWTTMSGANTAPDRPGILFHAVATRGNWNWVSQFPTGIPTAAGGGWTRVAQLSWRISDQLPHGSLDIFRCIPGRRLTTGDRIDCNITTGAGSWPAEGLLAITVMTERTIQMSAPAVPAWQAHWTNPLQVHSGSVNRRARILGFAVFDWTTASDAMTWIPPMGPGGGFGQVNTDRNVVSWRPMRVRLSVASNDLAGASAGQQVQLANGFNQAGAVVACAVDITGLQRIRGRNASGAWVPGTLKGWTGSQWVVARTWDPARGWVRLD
ncbi:MAG: hypothetical protein LBI49_25645 [Nocardiopsaceae bacterium]|jgi:hypothetical protein|nr:hypothetical protein [Nocardiopsaceae bacterium]